jgi:dCMP deaminase
MKSLLRKSLNMGNYIGEVPSPVPQQETRIPWDEYFMSTACLISRRSSCNKLHVGCVLVKDKRIIATGYNGHIPGQNHVSIVEDGHELATIHAEQNAICDCASRGIHTKDATAYITHYPCIYCFKFLVAAGIKEIVYKDDYKNQEYIGQGKLVQEGDIILRKYDPNILRKYDPNVVEN